MKGWALLSSAMMAIALFHTFARTVRAAPDNQANAAEASGDIDAIVVTAQRRSERLVDVPVSVDFVNSEEMQVKQINSVFDLGKSATSLSFE